MSRRVEKNHLNEKEIRQLEKTQIEIQEIKKDGVWNDSYVEWE